MSKDRNVTICVRINPDLLGRLKKAAEANWRLVSAEIGRRLEQSFLLPGDEPKDET